jgi:DNA-binding response OmpR family regulator
MSESNIILFLKQIVGSFSSFAIQKRISYIQQFRDYGIRAKFDKDKLEKIISNLISNALKFTPEQGAIIVNVSVITSTGSGEVEVQVTDTGRGIPEDQMSKIFERFYQVSEDGNVNVGTGIGLALCKELAEFLGGNLKMESKVGKGSRFTLSLPLETAELVETTPDEPIILVHHNEELRVDSALHVEDNLEKPIVLVAEDHSDLWQFIIECLGPNYSFIEASNGKEGLHHAIEQIPTLVLSDVMMPEMDGIEMCRKIKLDQRTSHIPVILLTAKASDDSKLSGLGIGADDYIIKPFNKEELKLKIRNQVAARGRMQKRIRLEFLSESTTIKAVSADEKFLERLKKVVETRISDELLSVESLTEEIGMSRAQLYRKVTALTGLSGTEFIRKLRLQRAAQLLQQQVGPVSQVAYEVGFSNLSYFSKCFKEQFGVLPSEYATKIS